jgi:hypothetical protein
MTRNKTSSEHRRSKWFDNAWKDRDSGRDRIVSRCSHATPRRESFAFGGALMTRRQRGVGNREWIPRIHCRLGFTRDLKTHHTRDERGKFKHPPQLETGKGDNESSETGGSVHSPVTLPVPIPFSREVLQSTTWLRIWSDCLTMVRYCLNCRVPSSVLKNDGICESGGARA